MKRSLLRILHLEDSQVDADLIRAMLEERGFQCDVTRVEAREEFGAALEQREFDLIISDFTLPSFDGLSALKLARRAAPNVPFIFVSGTIGEEAAIEALRSGATDYVLKQRMTRLVPAVVRALKEASERRQRHQAEMALRDSEERYRLLFESNPHPMWVYDLETLRFLAVNDAAVSHYGYSREEFLGMTIADIRPAEDLTRLRENVRAVSKGIDRAGIWRHRKKNGEIIDVEITSHELSFGGRKCEVVLANDVSERKQAERLRRAVYRIAEASNDVASLEKLFRAIHEIVGEVMPADNFYIALLDEEKDQLSFPYFVDEVDVPSPPQKPGKGLTEYVLRTGKALLCDMKTHEELMERGDIELVGAPSPIWLGVPLKSMEKTFGVMAVQHYSDENAYGKRETEMLEYVSSQVTKAIERKKAEEALSASERELRALFSAMTDIVLVLDGDGRYLQIAPTNPVNLYRPQDELLGKTIHEVLPKADADSIQKNIRLALRTNQTVSVEYSLPIGDTTIWFDGSVSPFGAGKVLWIARDITERKEAARKLEGERLLLRTILEAIPDEICVKDKERRFVLANSGSIHSLGQTSFEAIKGKRDEDLIVTSFAKEAREEEEKIFRTGEPLLNKTPSPRVNKETGRIDRAILTSKIPLKDPSGVTTGIVVVNRDITVLKVAADRISAFSQLGQQLNMAQSAPDAAQIIAETANRLIGWDACSIELYSRNEDRLTSILNIDTVDGKRITVESPLSGQPPTARMRTFLEQGDLILRKRGAQLSPDDVPFADTARVPLSLLFVPIRSGKETIGLLSIQSYRENAYGEEDFSTLQSLADYCAGALGRIQSAQFVEARERRYRALTENGADRVTLLSEDGTVLYVSGSSKSIFGFDVEELTGTNAFHWIHPDELVEARRVFGGLLGSPGRTITAKYRARHKDGTWRWIESKITNLLHDPDVRGVVLNESDVTERKSAEAALEQQRSHFERLFADSPFGIVLLDPAEHVINVNRAFEKIFQYTLEEIEGRTLSDVIVSGEHRNESREITERSLRGELVQVDAVRKRKDNTQVDVSITSYPIIIKGEIHGIYKIYADITESKKLGQQLRQAQKLEGIGTLAGGIAHDFNNILGIILTYTTVLDKLATNPAKFNGGVEAITKAVQRGASLVRQLLTFARQTDIKLGPVNVNDIIQELMKMLRATFPRTIEITSTLHKDIPMVTADASQVHQIILNLCVNARDAMPEGGSMSLETDVVEQADLRSKFPEASEARYVHVCVSDSGTGMSTETMARIFDPFFTTKEAGKGTGLGLAVVYGVTKGHGGFIGVRSELGKGTAFDVYLPVRASSKAEPVEMGKGLDEAAGGTETILIVEDEDQLLSVLQSILESKGYTVLTAVDGIEALEVYRTHRDMIDLVVTDMGLPKMGGWPAALKMKQRNDKLRVIFASGFLEPGMKVAMEREGFHHFIQKPYSLAEMLKIVRAALDVT